MKKVFIIQDSGVYLPIKRTNMTQTINTTYYQHHPVVYFPNQTVYQVRYWICDREGNEQVNETEFTGSACPTEARKAFWDMIDLMQETYALEVLKFDIKK